MWNLITYICPFSIQSNKIKGTLDLKHFNSFVQQSFTFLQHEGVAVGVTYGQSSVICYRFLGTDPSFLDLVCLSASISNGMTMRCNQKISLVIWSLPTKTFPVLVFSISLALEKRALVIEWPTKKSKNILIMNGVLWKQLKISFPPAVNKHKAMKIAKVISVMHRSIVGTRRLQCLDVITNLLKLLSWDFL